MKHIRQAKILQLIEEKQIDRQEELLAYLRLEGLPVTQATISRDIRELGLIKSIDQQGKYRYIAQNVKQSVEPTVRFEAIFRESVIDIDYAGYTVLVKCYSGMASAACEVFDQMHLPQVVGTLAGDDTFLVLMRSEIDAKFLCEKLKKERETMMNGK